MSSTKFVINRCQDLAAYVSARSLISFEDSSGLVFLDANELSNNLAGVDAISRYPEPQPRQLIERYSDYAMVDPTSLLATRGADEAIELIIRAVCEPGRDQVGAIGPTYGMYRVSCEVQDVDFVELGWGESWTLPTADVISSAGVKLLFICNPNNPSGTTVTPQSILALAEQLPDTLLVVDEAYIEFSPESSVVPAITNQANVVVLRTLSKAFGLAGARCGFLIGEAGLVTAIRKMQAPYPIPRPTSAVAIEALSSDAVSAMEQMSRNAFG